MRQQLFATLIVFLCLFSTSATAQQPLPADRDLIRDRQERLLEEQRFAAPRLFADPIGDGGDLQERIGRSGDAGKFAGRFQTSDELVQVFARHGVSHTSRHT